MVRHIRGFKSGMQQILYLSRQIVNDNIVTCTSIEPFPKRLCYNHNDFMKSSKNLFQITAVEVSLHQSSTTGTSISGLGLTCQELFKTQRYIPIPISVILFENISHPLQTDATLYKYIETHAVHPLFIVYPVEHRDELRREMIAEREQRGRVFVQTYSAAAIFVESVEKGPPCGEKAPKATAGELARSHIGENIGGYVDVAGKEEGGIPELIETNCPIPIRVEHPYHHSYSLGVKACKVSIDQRCPELIFSELPRSPLVYGFEQGEKRCIPSPLPRNWRAGRWRRSHGRSL